MIDKKNYFNNNIVNITKEAFSEAKKAGDNGEVPVGAVVFKGKNVISKAGNRVEQDNDATAHAEIIALKKAGIILKSSRLVDCSMYVTLQPCVMCTYAISLFRIKRLYFGAFKDIYEACTDELFFKKNNYEPEVYGGIELAKSRDLLKNFFKKIR